MNNMPEYSVKLTDLYGDYKHFQQTDNATESFLSYVRKEVGKILENTPKITLIGRSSMYAYYSSDFGYELRAFPSRKTYWPAKGDL